MRYLTFYEEHHAVNAQAQVAVNMGVPKWRDIEVLKTGMWGFEKPAEQYMTNLTLYADVVYDEATMKLNPGETPAPTPPIPLV